MSNFVVDLREPLSETAETGKAAAKFEENAGRSRRPRIRKILFGVALFAIIIAVIAGIGVYFYWQYLKTTPQYSLALIVDASRSGDKQTTDDLIDINSVVDDFLPQITSKAIELYGRGLPPETIAKFANIARPFLPAIKDRARAELPKMINDRTARFQNIPFFAMVFGADRYLDITIEGDDAQVISKLPDRPLSIRMHRTENRWRIVAVKDDDLATKVAQKIGQELVAIVAKGGSHNSGETLGIKNLTDMLKQAEDIFGDQ